MRPFIRLDQQFPNILVPKDDTAYVMRILPDLKHRIIRTHWIQSKRNGRSIMAPRFCTQSNTRTRMTCPYCGHSDKGTQISVLVWCDVLSGLENFSSSVTFRKAPVLFSAQAARRLAQHGFKSLEDIFEVQECAVETNQTYFMYHSSTSENLPRSMKSLIIKPLPDQNAAIANSISEFDDALASALDFSEEDIIKDAEVLFRVDQEYTLFWLDGTKDTIIGYSIADAMNRAGYGQGSIAALDVYSTDSDAFEWVDGRWTSPLAENGHV